MLNILNIGGFTQHDNRWHGQNELDEKIRAALDDYSPLSVRVHYYAWNSNWKEIATKLKLLRNRYPPPEPFLICVNGYSYGGGWGVVQLAKKLYRKGLVIQTANLCDAIYRDWLGKLGAWRAMYGGWPIRLPVNILEYHGFYQDVSRPAGVKPIGSVCKTWERLGVEHEFMDDEPMWHEHCLSIAKTMASEATSVQAVPVNAPISEATVARLQS